MQKNTGEYVELQAGMWKYKKYRDTQETSKCLEIQENTGTIEEYAELNTVKYSERGTSKGLSEHTG